MIRGLAVLPRRVVPQPTPHLNAGGDCGACVLAGLTGLTVADVYEQLQEEYEQPNGFCHIGMRNALWRARSLGLLDRVVADTPTWQSYMSHGCWGQPGYTQALQWGQWIRLGIEAGYYACCEVNHAREGVGSVPDHYLMLVGIREVRVPVGDGATRIDTEVLVSCSARSTPDEEWVEVGDFLRNRGGFNAMLARPAEASA